VSSASREVTERLRSLGYLSAAGLTTAGAESLPDPKRMIGSHADLEAAKRAVDDRRFAEAIPPFERVLELQGRNLVALLGLGMALNRTGEFERAERTYERALAVSPQNATALGGLAEAISGQERWADAIQLYQLAGRDPQQARTAESRIAFCLDRLGRHEEALARLEAAEQARPADRQHFRDLAGRLADYRRLAADPAQSDSLRLSRARVAAALGWLAEAERMLRPPASNPEGERARLRMLETLETELGRPQRALAVLDQLVRLEGPSAFTAVRRATLLLSAGRSAEAVDAFARLQDAELSRDGLLAAARYNEACALMRLGRHDEALAALGRAVQAGYDRLGVLLNDHDLAPLREDARFAALVETISARSGNADSPNAQAD